MKLIKPSFEIIEQGLELQDVYKHIELCGRTCYKSTDKITEDSAKPFVDRMINSQHYAMLEHGTVYLRIPYSMIFRASHHKLCTKYLDNPYSKCRAVEEFVDRHPSIPIITEEYLYVTTNFRVLVENKWLDDLKYLCEPTSKHYKRVTVKFICNRQVSHEFVRHRVFSFAQESTRYCNYTKDKFGNELTFILPCWTEMYPFDEAERKKMYDNIPEGDIDANLAGWQEYTLEGYSDHFNYSTRLLISSLKNIEKDYLDLISEGWQPQQAATILPNALKTELIMTGFIEDWSHFFNLRALGKTGKPHPQAEELARPLMIEFSRRGYI